MGQSLSEQREQTRRFWERHLQAWRESALLQSEYCRENQLKLHQFIYWKKKFPAAKPTVSLVEVPAGLFSPRPSVYGDCSRHESTTSGAPLRLFIDGRYCIEIQRGYDPSALEHLIQVLSRP